MPRSMQPADLVVVGAGTVGGWAACFAAEAGIGRVVVIERGTVGCGASSRAAGIVRAQGGTPSTVRLGTWSIDFYRTQSARYGTDSGFREHGYLILAATEEEAADARRRVTMQRDAGLDVRWVEPAEAAALNPALASTGYPGGSYLDTDGCIDPPRNVRAYSLAMRAAGVELLEHTEFLGVRTGGGARTSSAVTAVRTTAGDIEAERVLLTGGPGLRAVGSRVGCRIPVGAARHQVVVSEPHAAFAVERMPMVFDLASGIYWRIEEGGLLWGMSNPRERPGEAKSIDWDHLERMRGRLAELVPVTRNLGIRKTWAATIEFTPDHLPIVGAAIREDGELIEGATIASACGHGMMWGPAVARMASDVILDARPSVVDDAAEFGLDRFDEHGHSRLAADPIALPFPVEPGDD
jgi:sarcosine oxidase, subunit beta